MVWPIALVAAVLLVVALGWGWFEAGWLRTRVLEIAIPDLPAELDGIRIAHLSDFHLGPPSRGRRATEAAAAWASERRPDISVVTGDLMAHPRGAPVLHAVLERLGSPFVVLGNHDVAVSRDPFSRASELGELGQAVLLEHSSVIVDVRGVPVQIAGADPRRGRREAATVAALSDPGVRLRILLSHFPDVAAHLPAGTFHLVLAGHMHAGQICVPYPGGRLPLAHPRARVVKGVYRYAGTVLHVSPGLGTTFVPLRLFARPEVTELVLRTP